MQKLHGDREFLQDVIADTVAEVTAAGTISTLLDRLGQCKEEKANMERAILRYIYTHS